MAPRPEIQQQTPLGVCTRVRQSGVPCPTADPSCTAVHRTAPYPLTGVAAGIVVISKRPLAMVPFGAGPLNVISVEPPAATSNSPPLASPINLPPLSKNDPRTVTVSSPLAVDRTVSVTSNNRASSSRYLTLPGTTVTAASPVCCNPTLLSVSGVAAACCTCGVSSPHAIISSPTTTPTTPRRPILIELTLPLPGLRSMTVKVGPPSVQCRPVKAPIRFGTDGWRGIVADDFTYDNVRAVAQAVAWYLKDDSRPVVVGHDTRFSAELFAREVARVLAANGRHVLLLDGPAPTQVSSWTVVARRAAGGVVVTASHNPPEFNGLKYKPDYGGSAPPEVVEELEKLTARAQDDGITAMPFADAEAQGRVAMIDPRPDYIEQIGRMVDLPKLRNAGLRILHEAMHGSGAGYVKLLLGGGGSTTVDELHADRNPGFGGMHPEPIEQYMPEAMARMRAGGYDLGIANDGDADRVGIVDERGVFVNQLQVMALLSMYLLEKRGERGDLVRSLTSTGMVDKLGEKFGVPVHELRVGFKYIGPVMTETNALIGGEESGGFGFRGHLPERDGILAGLMVAQMIVDYGLPLSRILAHLEDLVGPHAYTRHDIRLERDGYDQRREEMYARIMGNPPQELAGARVVRTRDDDGFKFYLEDGSWVLVRFSGTEPLMRVYSEAPTRARVDELLAALESFLGVAAPAVGAAH